MTIITCVSYNMHIMLWCTYSRTHKYCNQNSSSSSTGFHHSFDDTIDSPSPSGTGAGVLVAIFMSPTVRYVETILKTWHQ